MIPVFTRHKKKKKTKYTELIGNCLYCPISKDRDIFF